MRLTITRKKVDLDECFPEDIDQYYDLATQYINLTTEDCSHAFKLSQKAWVLADRWAAIAANAGKLAMNKDKKINKTDLKDYCYRKYRQMQYIHEHCRMIWNKGEDAQKEKRVGK
ncbi:hypothetical protein Ccar_16670 [Clostridium carboxidivorans P7]|uniref:hypothetical protein n=1 Tax=Clostridium carboxidivorans TaxID=217159 RepID=UPI00064F8F1A|nr:hypothetical protein [Clostridium carboxidivorans]AKN32404.1 hypothetical protein Ccar_16670 [Clostridium carboxidivorans P7]